MFRTAPVRLRDTLKMIGIAILIFEPILPALLLTVWAAVTYTPTLTDSFGCFWHTSAFVFNLFILPFVTTLLIVPADVALLMAGVGEWAVGFAVALWFFAKLARPKQNLCSTKHATIHISLTASA